MRSLSCLYYLHALTSVHFGTGQGAGVIDQVSAREASTGLPEGPGSEIKGVLRDELLGDENDPEKLALFGPRPEEDTLYKGALNVGDARLLCLPVRALKGTFAWVTCPLVLYRYRRDLSHTGAAPPDGPPQVEEVDQILVAKDSPLRFVGSKVYVEDLDLSGMYNASAPLWAEIIGQRVFAGDVDGKTLFLKHFAVVHDAVFDHLCETALEIRARIRLNRNTHTVEEGPWYEENLPAESIMWGLMTIEQAHRPGKTELDTAIRGKSPKELLRLLPAKERLQVGGNATVGRGQVYWYRDLLRGEEGTPASTAEAGSNGTS